MFSNDAVLQRDKPVHVWGTAAAFESLTLSFNSQSVTGTADASGKWSLYLPAMPVNATGQALAIHGASASLTLTGVVLGDVWLASGQSNMEFPLADKDTAAPYNGWPDYAQPNGVADSSGTNLPNLRFYWIASWKGLVTSTPQEDFPASAGLGWARCITSNGNLKYYSALAFYIARDIHQTVGVPVGILQAAFGGTPAESFTSLEALQADPALAPAIPSGSPASGTDNQWPTGLFNGEINPLTPYTIKGILWNQGESNMGTSNGITPMVYETLFTSMIKDWRHRFGENLPFIYVQLPNISQLSAAGVNQAWADNCSAYYASNSGGMGDVRWSQFRALGLTNTGMSINYDNNPSAEFWSSDNTLLNATLWHPANKEGFAQRLTPWVRTLGYGLSVPVQVGPLYQSYVNTGTSIQVTFDKALATSDGQPARGFALGNAAGTTWVWAESVVLAGNVATVSAPSGMPNPAQCRYAWALNPEDSICSPTRGANLSDSSGAWLASPFKTFVEPVIQLKGAANTVLMDQDMAPLPADGRDFGSVDMVNFADQVFTIENIGSSSLSLTGGATRVRVAGANAGDFTVTLQPGSPVANGASTTFTVRFQPLGIGSRSAYLLIPSNDLNHSPFYIYLRGDGYSSITPSPTPNYSPTASPTISPTPSISPTAVIPCEDYDFETGTAQNWLLNTGPASSIAASTAQAHGGSYSLKADLALAPGAGNNQVLLNVYSGFPKDFTGVNLHAWVYVPSGMSDASNPSAAMLFITCGPAYTWNSTAWANISNAGGWFELVLDTTGIANINDTRTFGVQIALGGSSPAWSGTIYIDDAGRTSGVCAGTPTATRSATPYFSPSASPTPTSTPSQTLSATASFTRTATPSATLPSSATASPTATDTPNPAFSSTNTPIPSLSPSASVTPTVTPSLAAGSATQTSLPSATQTPSFTLTATVTASSTSVSGVTATPTLAGTPGTGLEVIDLKLLPNPNPAALAVKLSGDAEALDIRIYSVGHTLISKWNGGPVLTGWNLLALPLNWNQCIKNGAFYVEVLAHKGSEKGKPSATAKGYLAK